MRVATQDHGLSKEARTGGSVYDLRDSALEDTARSTQGRLCCAAIAAEAPS